MLKIKKILLKLLSFLGLCSVFGLNSCSWLYNQKFFRNIKDPYEKGRIETSKIGAWINKSNSDNFIFYVNYRELMLENERKNNKSVLHEDEVYEKIFNEQKNANSSHKISKVISTVEEFERIFGKNGKILFNLIEDGYFSKKNKIFNFWNKNDISKNQGITLEQLNIFFKKNNIFLYQTKDRESKSYIFIEKNDEKKMIDVKYFTLSPRSYIKYYSVATDDVKDDLYGFMPFSNEYTIIEKKISSDQEHDKLIEKILKLVKNHNLKF
ncbi:hypothetical protein [[Mycoplasma] collis]|uniref:hypothetical protein n=1 Tax=[Mycoplasma] collis TaxID=2127 RepID=UPI00051C8482|nr:hypothetical protein [[Mycoplasma] collis]